MKQLTILFLTLTLFPYKATADHLSNSKHIKIFSIKPDLETQTLNITGEFFKRFNSHKKRRANENDQLHVYLDKQPLELLSTSTDLLLTELPELETGSYLVEVHRGHKKATFVFSFTVETEEESGSESTIGSLEVSLLDPLTFSQLVGDPLDFNPEVSKWVFADGRNIQGSHFSQVTGRQNIPDMRAMFLRGMNQERADGLEDPEGDLRQAGDLQADSFQGHGHLHEVGRNGADFSTGTFQGVFGLGTYIGTRVLEPATIERFGQARFGSETRPKNVSVYYYIRIN